MITCIGDSQTDYGVGYTARPKLMWPTALSRLLVASGLALPVRSFGVSGDTSASNLARADVIFQHDNPLVGVIYIGVNDPGAAISQATTQANIQALIKAFKYGVAGSQAAGAPSFSPGVTVPDQTTLPATGTLRQRYVVLSDTSTTGGAAAWLPSQHSTIAGAGGSVQTVWEFRYNQVGERGWGRVATATTAPFAIIPASTAKATLQSAPFALDWGGIIGCPFVVVVSANYLNFTPAVLSSPLSTGAPITALPINALPAFTNTGTVKVVDAARANSQDFNVTAAQTIGATSLPVTSQTPTFAFPAGSIVTQGDCPAFPYTPYSTVHAAQAAATAAENVTVGGLPSVVFADLYGLMKARIVTGTDPDFTVAAFSQAQNWHYVQNNQHHSPYGQDLVALAVYNAISAAGWLPDL